MSGAGGEKRRGRVWTVVHRWTGWALAAPVVLMSLSGAALAWRDALDRALHPARSMVGDGRLLKPDVYVRVVRARLRSGDRIARMTLPANGSGDPVAIAVRSAAAPSRTVDLRLDPATARVLDAEPEERGVVARLRALHARLLIDGAEGRSIVAGLGALLAICVVAGVGVRGGARAHRLLGLLSAAPLFVLAATGAALALSGSGRSEGGTSAPSAVALARARPLARPAQPLAAVIARARAYAPGGLREVDWPTDVDPDWTLRFGANDVRVKVADDSGSARPALARQPGDVDSLARRIHAGGGVLWRIVASLSGLAAAWLAATGVVASLRRRGRPAEGDGRAR